MKAASFRPGIDSYHAVLIRRRDIQANNGESYQRRPIIKHEELAEGCAVMRNASGINMPNTPKAALEGFASTSFDCYYCGALVLIVLCTCYVPSVQLMTSKQRILYLLRVAKPIRRPCWGLPWIIYRRHQVVRKAKHIFKPWSYSPP